MVKRQQKTPEIKRIDEPVPSSYSRKNLSSKASCNEGVWKPTVYKETVRCLRLRSRKPTRYYRSDWTSRFEAKETVTMGRSSPDLGVDLKTTEAPESFTLFRDCSR